MEVKKEVPQAVIWIDILKPKYSDHRFIKTILKKVSLALRHYCVAADNIHIFFFN